MYQGTVTREIVGYDEWDCPIYKDEEGRVIHTSPHECEFLKIDEEEHLNGR